MITHVQIKPTTRVGPNMFPASPQEVEYGYAHWSVYTGAPGAFDWQADFQNGKDAKMYALQLCAAYGAQLIEGTT